jgi:hypothetical protein
MTDGDDVDELIEQITLDAYADEGYWSFLQAFTDGVRTPVDATVIGVAVRVTGFDFDGDERGGLVAAIERDGVKSTISLLDVNVPSSAPTARRLVAAYRRWLGIE